MQAPASMFLITGFLGSGKTTFLNGVLAALSGKRVGVIVNEWGKIGVDGRLLLDPSGLGVVELAGGQIFCSCVSGSFIAAAVRLASLGLDYLLVETSGLAKPAVLETIVAEAERRSAGALSYKGMVCVADAGRFAIIRKAAAVVDEQAAYSDRFVLTKTDTASPRAAAETRAALAELRPGARVVEVVRGAVDASILADAERLPAPAADPRFRGWGAAGRPGTTSLRPAAPVEEAALAAFLSDIAPEAYRVKGFLRLAPDGRPGLVDCVGEAIAVRRDEEALRAAPADEGGFGLAIIWKGAPRSASEGRSFFAERVERLWRGKVGAAAEIS